MIFKKQIYRTDKKVNPIIGALLFFISIILILVTGPIGFVYGILHNFFNRGVRGMSEFLLKIAISIDQLGNVLMQHLLNDLWIKKSGYKFGNRDETISSALGRNKKLNRLTLFGKVIDRILDVIDPDHSLNSIDYYIEPSNEIIDMLAWIHIVEGKILCTKGDDQAFYTIPSGSRSPGQTDAQALHQRMSEVLGISLDVSSIRFIGIFEAQAAHHKPGILVRMTCYSAAFNRDLQPATNINEIVWLNYSDRNMVSKVDTVIFDFLYEKGLLIKV